MKKITIALYDRDTFNIFNHIPTYFTRTDVKGRFNITNLKAGNIASMPLKTKTET